MSTLPFRSPVVVACLVTFVVACDARAADPDLVIQTRAIFKKYCVECHHAGETIPGTDLDLWDHAGVTLADDLRGSIVSPPNPGASRLIEFVEAGAMPPGTRDKLSPAEIEVLRRWIAEGAQYYPERFDDEYVLRQIEKDLKSKPPQARTNYRYLTLHAPLAFDQKGAISSLAAAREELRTSINSILPQPRQLQELTAVDGAGVVFAVELAKLGWDKPLFRWTQDVAEDGPAGGGVLRFNVWDILLLEYPYGKNYAKSPLSNWLEQNFLKPAEQVRPVLFLRGDWFVQLLRNHESIGQELAALSGRVIQPEKVDGETEKLTIVPVTGSLAPDDPKKLLIPAIDAMTCPDLDHTADSGKFTAEVYMIDPQQANNPARKAKNKFTWKEKFLVEMKASAKVYKEIIVYFSNGMIIKPPPKPGVTIENAPYRPLQDQTDAQGNLLVDALGNPVGYSFTEDDLGEERLVLFATRQPGVAEGRIYVCTINNKQYYRYVHEWPDPNRNVRTLFQDPGFLKDTFPYTVTNPE